VKLPYPEDFPLRSRARVELVFQTAEQELFHPGKPDSDLGTRCKQLAKRVFFAFVNEACNLSRYAKWTPEKLRLAIEEFLQSLISSSWQDAISRYVEDPSEHLYHTGEALMREIASEIRTCADWAEYLQQLRAITTSKAELDSPAVSAKTRSRVGHKENPVKRRRGPLVDQLLQKLGGIRRSELARKLNMHDSALRAIIRDDYTHGGKGAEAALLKMMKDRDINTSTWSS